MKNQDFRQADPIIEHSEAAKPHRRCQADIFNVSAFAHSRIEHSEAKLLACRILMARLR